MNINLEEIEIFYDLDWNTFEKYVNLVSNNCFKGETYTPCGKREAMYFGFLMFCTNLEIDFEKYYDKISNHNELLRVYHVEYEEHEEFFDEVEKFVDKTVNHILQSSYHNLEYTIADLIKSIKSPLLSLTDSIQNKVDALDTDGFSEVFSKLKEKDFTLDKIVESYIELTKETNENDIIKTKNEIIRSMQDKMKREVLDELRAETSIKKVGKNKVVKMKE